MEKDNRIETIRSLLRTLGFDPCAIEAGLSALVGTPPAVVAVPEEPLLSPKQLCARLDVSITTLWRMKPPFIRVGARKRFMWCEVKEFLAKQTERKAVAA